MRKFKIVVPLLALLFLIGCAGTLNLTPSAKYYSALKIWNDNLDTYLAAYRVAPPATQAKWKATVDPFIMIANQALDTWRLSLGTANAASNEQVWQDAQKKAMALFVQVGVIKIGGGN
jgi:hypothetical protein